MSIHYSCLKCGKKFLHMDNVENHLEEEHGIFDQEEIDKSYLIHFYPLEKGEFK